MEVLPWMTAVCSEQDFFDVCTAEDQHHTRRSSAVMKNLFCVDCMVKLCPSCQFTHDKEHTVLRVRRGSEQNAIKAEDLSSTGLMDIKDIQLAKINKHKIVYIGHHLSSTFPPIEANDFVGCKQRRGDTSSTKSIDKRLAKQNWTYCSIACKIAGLCRVEPCILSAKRARASTPFPSLPLSPLKVYRRKPSTKKSTASPAPRPLLVAPTQAEKSAPSTIPSPDSSPTAERRNTAPLPSIKRVAYRLVQDRNRLNATNEGKHPSSASGSANLAAPMGNFKKKFATTRVLQSMTNTINTATETSAAVKLQGVAKKSIVTTPHYIPSSGSSFAFDVGSRCLESGGRTSCQDSKRNSWGRVSSLANPGILPDVDTPGFGYVPPADYGPGQEPPESHESSLLTDCTPVHQLSPAILSPTSKFVELMTPIHMCDLPFNTPPHKCGREF